MVNSYAFIYNNNYYYTVHTHVQFIMRGIVICVFVI